MTEHQSPEPRLAERGSLLLNLLRREKGDHLRRIATWGGLSVAGRTLAGIVALVALAAATPGLPRPVGIVLGLAAWSGFAWLVWRYLLRPWRAVPNLAVFARLVEERHDFRDLLRAALEFSQRGVPPGQSSDLVAATVNQAYDEASQLRLTRLFDFPRRRRDGMFAGAAAVVLLGLVAVSPKAPGRVARGLVLQWPTPAEIQYGTLADMTGDRTVLAGEDVDVAVRESGPRAPEMVLRFNDTGDLWKSRLLESASGTDPRDYAFKFEDVHTDLTYRFESAGRHTTERRIHVVQRPIVSQLHLTISPPAYTGRKPVALEEGRGDGVALRGSRIEIEALASTALHQARLVPEPAESGAAPSLSGPLPMQTSGKAFRAQFALRGDVRYHFDLLDSLGHTNAAPVSYQLSVIDDREPYVELRQPGQDVDLPPSLDVVLSVYAADDFGIAKMTLFSKVEKAADAGVPADDSAGGMASGPASGSGDWSGRVLDLHGEGTTDGEGHALAAGTPAELIKTFKWSHADTGLFPGDAVAYFVEVEDNDAVSGHKKARTQVYRLRLQTISELYAKIHQGDEKRLDQIDDAIEKSRQLKDKYEKLARELKKNPEMDWQKEKEVQNALEKQNQLGEQVQKIAEDLDKNLKKLETQQMVSKDIAQKMEEIQKLLEQVQDDSMRRYLEKLREAMKQISPEELQRAMEQMNLSQEEFLKRLERTKSLLEQLKREQKLDAMIERVGELLRNQEKVAEKTQQLDPDRKAAQDAKQSQDAKDADAKNRKDQADAKDAKDSKDGQDAKDSKSQDAKDGKNDSKDAKTPKADTPQQLAEEQQDLAQKTGELQKDLDDLSKESQQAGQDQLDQTNRDLQEQNPSGEMDQASKQLQKEEAQGAQPHQQKAQKSLRSLYQQLMQAQQQMSMQQDAETAAALQKAARQALDVSFRQEDVTKESATAARMSDEGDLAVQQQALVGAAGKIATDLDAVSQKTSKAPSQVQAMLGEAMGRMRDGVRSYEKGDPITGRVQGEEAYGILNRIVVELNRSSSSSCNKPGSGQGSQQKMQQLMGQQQQLNDLTRQLREQIPNPQNLSPEQRAQMSRLLGEQRSIEQQLQDIERQAREQRELLGRLDKMQDEMHEVVQDMESQHLDDETLRVQEKIVSRMLDAQRSLHKRDFNEERESRTAENIFSKGGTMPQDSDRLKKLRHDIDRALREGTPEEYEDLVREYFRAISEAPAAPDNGPVP